MLQAGVTDPAGGSGGDSMTLAISHHDRGADKVMLAVLREARPPFNPKRVVEEFAEVLTRYRVRVVVGDRYGGDWPGRPSSGTISSTSQLTVAGPTSTATCFRCSPAARWSFWTTRG